MTNDKIQFLIGFVLGLIACGVGALSFLYFFSDVDLAQAIPFLKSQKSIGKVLAIGCVLNLLLFFGLLKFKKEFIAKGVILSVIVLAIFSIFL